MNSGGCLAVLGGQTGFDPELLAREWAGRVLGLGSGLVFVCLLVYL